MPETVELVLDRLSYLLALVLIGIGLTFFASNIPITGIFFFLASFVIMPISQQYFSLKGESRLLLMSILLVVGILFMPPLYEPLIN